MGKGCPSLIYSNVGLLLADVRLRLFPTQTIILYHQWVPYVINDAFNDSTTRVGPVMQPRLE